MRAVRALGFLFTLSIAAACGGGDSSGAQLDEEVFDPAHVVEVDIQMAPADWDTIRKEGRSLNQVFSGCGIPDLDYTHVSATVTIDGETLTDVGVRKKGFLGSLSTVRPSLKLNFDTFLPDQRYLGMKRMTLNNNRQDPSNARQCLAYEVFALAGVATPRCNLARVTVNGADLGIYTHVESIKKPFLEGAFGFGDGNLYEGRGSDFRDDFIDTFEFKNNALTTDGSELVALKEALQSPDDQLLSALHGVLDVNGFMSYWAAETLTSHWDGYSGNTNNFFVYANPATGLQFIPWGTDGAFDDHVFRIGQEVDLPASVFAFGELSRRLYEVPETREMYRQRLSQLILQWSGGSGVPAELSRISQQSGDWVSASEVMEVQEFARTRVSDIQAELAGDAPVWTLPRREVPECKGPGETMTVTFDTTWGKLESPVAGNHSVDVSIDGTRPTLTAMMAKAGDDPDSLGNGQVSGSAIRVIGRLPDNTLLVVQLTLGPVPLAVGEIPMHGAETIAIVARLGTNLELLGMAGEGTLTLEVAGTNVGDQVKGSFSGRLVEISELAL